MSAKFNRMHESQIKLQDFSAYFWNTPHTSAEIKIKKHFFLNAKNWVSRSVNQVIKKCFRDAFEQLAPECSIKATKSSEMI